MWSSSKRSQAASKPSRGDLMSIAGSFFPQGTPAAFRRSRRAFAAGIKGQTKKDGLNWRLTVSQPLQPVDGALVVSYDNYYGRLVTRKVALADNRDLRTALQVSLVW